MYRSHRFRARKSRIEDFKKLVLLLWSTVPLCLIPKPLPHLIVGVAWLLQLVFLLDPCKLHSTFLPTLHEVIPNFSTSPGAYFHLSDSSDPSAEYNCKLSPDHRQILISDDHASINMKNILEVKTLTGDGMNKWLTSLSVARKSQVHLTPN